MTPSVDPRIKLRHLQCFVEVEQQGGVAKAGTALGMTQPAVSKAIAELEGILGVALFDRTRRALTLSSFGQIFMRFARTSLATLRQGVATVGEAKSGSNVVAFGALPSVSASIVPRALIAFAASPLACRVVAESGPSVFLMDLLRGASIDFVVGRMPKPDAMIGLSFEHLYSEELVWVVRPGHPLQSLDRLEPAALELFQLVMPPLEGIIRGAVDEVLLGAGVSTLRAPIETVSNSLGRSYTLSSDAIWIVSHGVVAHDIGAGQLVRLPIRASANLGHIGITTRTGGEISLASVALIDEVRLTAAAVRGGAVIAPSDLPG